jgi:hypothetical protein
VSGEAGCDVDRDAGVRPAIAAHEQIEPPALGHADRLPDAAPPLGRNCSRWLLLYLPNRRVIGDSRTKPSRKGAVMIRALTLSIASWLELALETCS